MTVSVVIPTFNRPDYLRIALQSVQTQTYKDIEVIVHDNGSVTDIASVIAQFPQLRVRYYRNERNIGQTPNIVAAIRRATGKYLALLADDDSWNPDFLERMVAALDARSDCVLAFANYDMIDKNGDVLAPLTLKMARYHGNHLLIYGYHDSFEYIATMYRSITVISGCVLRRGVADWADVPNELSVGIDTYIGFMAARLGQSCYFDPAHLFQIRWHAGTVTSSGVTDAAQITSKHRAYLVMWDRMLNDPVSRLKHYYRMKRGWYAAAVILDLVRFRQWQAALREILIGMRNNLLDVRVPFYLVAYLVRFKCIGLDRRFIP